MALAQQALLMVVVISAHWWYGHADVPIVYPNAATPSYPVPVPSGYGSLADVAAAASPSAVAAAGGRQAFAATQCAVLSANLRGTTREFLDFSIPLWTMAENVAYAAYLYGGDTVDVWADVFSTCQGGDATALGYATAFMYLEGGFRAIGFTLIYEQAIKRRGCGPVTTALDVAAALVVGRKADDDLKPTVTSYSSTVGQCVPAKCCIRAKTLPNPPFFKGKRTFVPPGSGRR